VSDTIAVTVAYAAPGIEVLRPLTLPADATVADAVAASGIVEAHALAREAIAFAIFGQRADAAIPLRDGDRVEITRPLVADPKESRRARAADRPLAPSSKPPRRRGLP
jgi:hypothetical protein